MYIKIFYIVMIVHALGIFSHVHAKKWSSTTKTIITINADASLGYINRLIFGNNIEWTYNGDTIWDPVLNEIPLYIRDRIYNLGITIMRFPGGLLSGTYHWHTAVGPVSQRAFGLDFEGKLIPQNFGTDEFMYLVETLNNCEKMLTVNFRSGTLEEAASWVDYCNNPDNVERIGNGHLDAYNVKYWEIGNENYLDYLNYPAISPQNYAEGVIKFAESMRKVDPMIKIGAQTTSGGDWTETVLDIAGSSIDFVIEHYYFPFANENDFDIHELNSAVMASPLIVERCLREINRLLEKYHLSKSVEIAVTEYNTFYTSPSCDNTYDLVNAIYVADMVRVFIENQVSIAEIWSLIDNWYFGCLAPSYKGAYERPHYFALELLAKHTGNVNVQVKIDDSPRYNLTKYIGNVSPIDNIPYLTAFASKDTIQNKLYLVVINKHQITDLPASVTINDFFPNKNVQVWTLNGSDINSNNEQYRTVKIRKYLLSLSDSYFQHNFPAHSISVFEFNAKETSVVEASFNEHNFFDLIQNYPNPFNHSATIRFSLPRSSFVILKVYDLLGKEIETLIRGQLSAGEHEVKWIAKGLPTGIYLYRLQAEEFKKTKKVILQK